MAMIRLCILCRQTGITVEFPNGNGLKRHIRQRHNGTAPQMTPRRVKELRRFRKQVLLERRRFGMEG